MSKPIVAVVGRPNVGKSTLFNKLVGRRLSIVEDTPGVTRDRIYGDSEWRNRPFMLIDTGGIEPASDDVILSQMRSQAQLAIDSADVIVMVTDLRSGVVATDMEVAAMLQKSGRPVVLCWNKWLSEGYSVSKLKPDEGSSWRMAVRFSDEMTWQSRSPFNAKTGQRVLRMSSDGS